MARDHGEILYRIWSDEDFTAMNESAQRLFFLVLSQPGITFAGVVPLTTRRWANLAKDSTPKKLATALAECVEDRFLVADEDTDELMVRSYVRNDGIMGNPNLAIAAMKAYRLIASPFLRAVVLIELRRLWCEDSQAKTPAKAWTSDASGDVVRDVLTDPLPKGVPDGLLHKLYKGLGDGLLTELGDGFSLTRARDARVALTPSLTLALAPTGARCLIHADHDEPCPICEGERAALMHPAAQRAAQRAQQGRTSA